MSQRQLAMWLVGVLTTACHPWSSCPTPAPSLAVAAPPDFATEILGPVAERGVAEGALPFVVVAAGAAAEGDRLGGFVELPRDRCVLVFARGSKGVADIDLFAFADDGASIAADESSSAEAALVLCPPMPGRAFLTARVASGAGLVALGAQEVPVERAPRAANAVGARAMGEESGRLESWPGLEAKVLAHRRAIGSSWEDVRRFASPVDPRAPTRTSLSIEAGRCLDVLVTPSEEVASLEVTAETSDGRIAARAQVDGRDRTMVLCSELGEQVSITARPRGSSGLAAFVIGRSPRGASAEVARSTRVDRLTQTLSVDSAKKELALALDGAWGKAKSAGAGQARVGGRTSVPLSLGRGCSRIDVVAGAPLAPVTAALWGHDGALLAESSGALRATLYACTDAPRAARLDVESLGRPGPFAVELRLAAQAERSQVETPLAAARLFDRAIAAGTIGDGPPSGVRVVELEPGKLETWSHVVPEQSCIEIIAALDGGATGLELRIIDEATGEDALSRGRFAASQRMCAHTSPRRARVELLVDFTAAKALILKRDLRE